MLTTKLSYSAPEMEVFEVRLDSTILQGSPTGESFGTQSGSDDESGWN